MYFGDLTHANQNAHRVIVVATLYPSMFPGKKKIKQKINLQLRVQNRILDFKKIIIN